MAHLADLLAAGLERVLDLGCGDGVLIARRWRRISVDAAPRASSFADDPRVACSPTI